MTVEDEVRNTDPLLMHMEQTRTSAKRLAAQHIAMFRPFTRHDLPQRTRKLSNFFRLADTNELSRKDLLQLLDPSLDEYLDGLRAAMLNHPHLNDVRVAVLVHVGMEIGLQELLELRALWDAIRAQAWEDAADVLQMSRWPSHATTTEQQLRVLELARMMRTGAAPARMAA